MLCVCVCIRDFSLIVLFGIETKISVNSKLIKQCKMREKFNNTQIEDSSYIINIK